MATALLSARTLRLDGQPVTVIGVMPSDFYFLNPDVLLWRPLAFTPEQKGDELRHSNNFQNIGRLKPGATIARAQQQVDAINARNLELFPAMKPVLINAGFHTSVEPLQDTLVRDIKSSLYLMWGGALFVLLIGCVNVANLVLVRSRVRLRDHATRLALGAGRARLARQLVAESAILTLVSAVLGLLVGYASLQALGTLNIQDLPRGTEIRLDGIVVAATFLMAAAIGGVIGLIPLAHVLHTPLTTVLREEGRSGTAGRRTRFLRRMLVVIQVGFAFVLLIGAGLLFASFRQVLAIEPGFNPDRVLTASIALPRSRYADDTALIGFTREALRRLRALPGVSAAGATNAIPFGGNNSNSVIFAEGYQMKPGESVISPRRVDVSPGFFEAMGVKLVHGRFFDDRDVITGPVTIVIGGQRMSPRSIIVDETLARRFWPGQDPIGRRMYLPNDLKDLTAITATTVFHTVVGVIADIKLRDLTEGQQSVGAYHFSTDQEVPGFLTFAVKTAGDPLTLTECRARSDQRARPRVTRVRHAKHGAAAGTLADDAALAARAVVDFWRRGAPAVRDRYLRRAGVSRDTAAKRIWHSHRVGQWGHRDLRAGPARGTHADWRGSRSRRFRRVRPAQEPPEPAIWRRAVRSVCARRGDRTAGVRRSASRASGRRTVPHASIPSSH